MDQSVLSKLSHRLPPSTKQRPLLLLGCWWRRRRRRRRSDIIKTHWERAAVNGESLLLAACSWFGTYSSEVTAAAQWRIMQMTFDYGCGETGGEVVVSGALTGGCDWNQTAVWFIFLTSLSLAFPSFIFSPFFFFSTRLENPPGIKIAPYDGASNYLSQTRDSALNGGTSGRRLPRGRRRIKLMTITEGFVVVSRSLALQRWPAAQVVFFHTPHLHAAGGRAN